MANINSIASVINMFAGSEPVKAELIPLDANGSERIALGRGFQYFPENISDSKSANYATKNIPGGSHPLYQFINGGDRTITFTAIFTSDEDTAPPELLDALRGGIDLSLTGILGSIGRAVGISDAKKHTVPVESAVIWLRSFMYPRYSPSFGGGLGSFFGGFGTSATVSPPPVVRLYLPNSGVHGVTKNGTLVVDSVDCIMTQCDVVYETFYRNGTQRITTVNLSFNETVQTGASNWRFADGVGLERAYSTGVVTKGSIKGPYPIRAKGQGFDLGDALGFLRSLF